MSKNTAKTYYLFDTSAVLHNYIPNKKVTHKIDHVIEQHGLKRAFLFIPQFCVTEVFNTFAKLHYRKKKDYPEKYQETHLKGNFKSLTTEEYDTVCKNFKKDIKFGHLFYNYELSRYHTFNADYILPFEHREELIRINNRTKEELPWFLSSFDILIIAMGIEVARINGEGRTIILTCDKRMKVIADKMRSVIKTPSLRKKYSIPDHIRVPKTLYLYEATIKDLPKVSGQSSIKT